MATSYPNSFVIEMNSLLERAEAAMPDKRCCIYRVPDHIRKLNEDSFTPQVVSIGPFHYKHPKLQNMEKYKLLYLKNLLKRSGVSLDTLISFVEDIEPDIHSYYSEPITLSRKNLVKVILLDSCFLFELFLSTFYGEWQWHGDDGELKPWLDTAIRLDLLLLENQLPFHELEKLFNVIFPCSTTNDEIYPSFLELTFDYFKHYYPGDLENDLENEDLELRNVRVSHFTDLIRTFHLLPWVISGQTRKVSKPPARLQSVTELAQAGVIIRKSKSSSLFDFKFSREIFEIPNLEVDDLTEIWLRNLVALEQCHYPFYSYITDYVTLMDFLVNTSTDVDLLVQEGIIINRLGETNSVANLFNSLGKHVLDENFSSDFSKICKDLNGFCESPWNNMKANLRHRYFNTPWQGVVSIAAILVLLLTMIQTFTSILQVVQQYKPSSSH